MDEEGAGQDVVAQLVEAIGLQWPERLMMMMKFPKHLKIVVE